MREHKIPKWFSTSDLSKVASPELERRRQITVNLPTKFQTISSYECDICRLKFTTGQIEPQLRKAARAATLQIECPKCAGFLKETDKVVVRSLAPLKNRAERLIDKNEPIQRGINTWIDKAIYGKLVNAIGEYIEGMGIVAPILKFQRGIRSSKFPGEPMSAKGAEFTVEFTDFNNTRNRIIIQAGLDASGKFIYPRTFSTLSGNEYPLNARTIKDFVSGKVYDPVIPDHSLPPLNYRYTDPTRFREISANTQRIVKKAMGYTDSTGMAVSGPATGVGQTSTGITFTDESQIIQHLNDIGISQEMNPAVFDMVKNQLMQNIQSPQVASDNMGAVPTSTSPSGNFMQGVGVGASVGRKKMKKKSMHEFMMEQPIMTDGKNIALAEAIDQGLAYGEAYDHVRTTTGLPLTLAEFDIAGQIEANADAPIETENIAQRLLATAEVQMATSLYTVADKVKQEYDLSDMTDPEAQTWADTYVDVHNTSLTEGLGLVESKRRAHIAAIDKLAEIRIKLALRDKSTLVPFTDPDPDYSVAQQTHDSEARFDMKYHETDGGISELKDRNVTHMFRKETTPPAEAKEANTLKRQKTAEPTGVDLSPDEVGQNPINMSRLKTLVQDYIRAGNIPPTKVDLHKLKDGGYTLTELKTLVDSVKTKDDSAFYPTVHAKIDLKKVHKLAEDKIADMYKEMPIESAEPESAESSPDGITEPISMPMIQTENLEEGVSWQEPEIPQTGFDPSQLAMGVEVELAQVRNDRELAEEIVRNRLTEIPDYYSRLAAMKETAKQSKAVKDTPSLIDKLKIEATKKIHAEGK